jgi:hypothetical protein
MTPAQQAATGQGTGADSLSPVAGSWLPTIWQTTPAVGSGSDESNEKHVAILLGGLAVVTIVVGILNVTVKIRGRNVVDV